MWVHDPLPPRRLDEYEGVAPEEQLEEARSLGRQVAGLRVVHVNSTAQGGGVAEILQSMVPLMRDIGIDARWFVMPGATSFFDTTKRLHNLLQGAEGEITDAMWGAYRSHVDDVASQIRSQGIEADVWIMHDPQSLPLAQSLNLNGSAMWVCHIDTTAPNPSALRGVLPLVAGYPLVLFSMPQYVLPGIPKDKVRIAPPAIDPLIVKNRLLQQTEVRSILQRLGVDPDRPLLCQVARFDRWKDPFGVIDAYRLVKKQVPDVQLALLGVIVAQDDPEAYSVVEDVRAYAQADPDIHLFTDPQDVGEVEVAAFQTGSTVMIQKSLREGFGLSVTEALWKGSPTVAGNCGGIRIQITDGDTGYLVSSVEECASRILQLLEDREFAQRMGNAGRHWVKKHFLLPRLTVDYMGFIRDIAIGSSQVQAQEATLTAS